MPSWRDNYTYVSQMITDILRFHIYNSAISPLSYLVYINGFVTRITRGATLVEVSLLTLWEHMGSPHFKRGSCQLLVLVRYLSTIVCLHHFLLWRDAGISSSDKFLFISQSVIGKYRTITH